VPFYHKLVRLGLALKRNNELATNAFFAFNPDRAAHLLYQVFAD
jgi:hypothetical protein